MTQSKITATTIESSSYQTIFDEINKRTNVADPRDVPGNGSRRFLYDFDPFHLAISFSDMPYIVLELPTILGVNNKKSIDGTNKALLFTHRIVVRTTRRGAAQINNLDLGRTDMFGITNDLQAMFNKRSVKDTLACYGISDTTLVKISTDTLSVDAKYVYEAVYELSYKVPWLEVNS